MSILLGHPSNSILHWHERQKGLELKKQGYTVDFEEEDDILSCHSVFDGDKLTIWEPLIYIETFYRHKFDLFDYCLYQGKA